MKKLLSIWICFLLLISSIPALALDNVIYKTESQTTVALGVTETHTRYFTKDGWQNVNVVRADLSKNPYIKAVPLFNEKGTSVGQSVLNMAKDHDTLAAINSDFFDKIPGKPGRVSPIGTIVEDGNIVSTPAHDSGFATFYTDKNGDPFFGYFTYSLKVISPSGVDAPIKHINKFNFNGDIVLLDKNWNAESIGSTDGKCELVVQNDTVIEKRENMPPVAIPDNGYVLNCSLSFSSFLMDYFSVGEKVIIEKYLTPDLSQIQNAVGTGSMVLKDGNKTPLTFDTPGINPRSAVGFDATGNILYLITVDGRQDGSIGMTTQQMTDFMLELGITDGAICDGGGSTNLAVKNFETGQQEIINQPSENARPVASGIGLTSTAPLSDLKGLILFDDYDQMFVNGKDKLNAVGYDQYFNRIEIDQSQVKYSVSGVSGNFEGSVFNPSSPGIATITGSYNGITGTKTINVLDNPIYLSIPTSYLELNVGETKDFAVQAKDKDGFSAPVPLDNLKINTQNGCVSFNNQKITGISGGEDFITFEFNGIESSAKVVVNGGGSQTEAFETLNGKFAGYPSYVQGSYELSSEQVKNGSYSGKLSFDFTDNNDDLRAAYLEFNNPITLPTDTSKISLWMYSDQNYGHMLRGMIYDADGNPARISFTNSITSGGWQYLEAQIPSDIKYPASLSRLYVVQNDKTVKNTGQIYLDDLSIISPSSGEEPSEVTKIPNNTAFEDPLNRDPSDNNNAFVFSVYGNIKPSDTLLMQLTNRRLVSKLNNSCQLSIFLGDINWNMLDGITNEKLVTYGYGSSVYNDVTMIRLDNSVDGLRKTNAQQWTWFLDTLDHVNTDNVILYLPKPVSQKGFSDPLELNLFYEILTEKLYKNGKTAFVVYPDDYITTDIKDGVRYFSVADMPDLKATNVLSKLPYLKYFEFALCGKDLTYQVKSIF